MYLNTLKLIVGWGFKGLGLFWAIGDKFLCKNLCKDSCSIVQNTTCSLLFLFVGIIFIVCGFALIVMKDTKRRKLKTKIKNALEKLRGV